MLESVADKATHLCIAAKCGVFAIKAMLLSVVFIPFSVNLGKAMIRVQKCNLLSKAINFLV